MTDNGAPVAGTELRLYYDDGSTESVYATTTTDAGGYYEFTDLPTLAAGQKFYVEWLNSDYNPDRLWLWWCEEITPATSDPNDYCCDFDLDNVELVAPGDGATVALPYTLTGLPAGFEAGQPYDWWVWINGSGQGGVSYQMYEVTFSNTGAAVAVESVPISSRYSRDMFKRMALSRTR